jgi:pentatricopeptide repeat protein
MHHFLLRVRAQLRTIGFLRKIVFGLRAIRSGPETAALVRAGKLMEAGNFNAAATCLEAMKTKRKVAWQTLLRCYSAAHRFEDLFSTYERMPIEFKVDLASRHLYLSAAANLRRPDTIKDVIDDLLRDTNKVAASKLLNRVYPFAERFGSETHKAIVERIVSHRSELVLDHFDSALKCAHDLRAKGWEAEALALEKALRDQAGDVKSHIKLAMFDAQVHFWNGRYDLQLAAINDILAKQSIAPVALIDPDAPFACENLKVPSIELSRVEGPLVSILMPAYNSADTIGYALESLRNQTYRNIEVIVVDDASSDETTQIVSQFSVADPRFRLVGLDKNSGTFIARNLALAAANGDYVTNQDADDWAHPQKIATAVAELQRDQSIIGTWVEHIRCSSQRGFRAISGYIRPDASSLMFRRKPVTEKVGWYDSVRAAGDGEFHLRVERAFGRRSIRQLGKLLSFVSWSESSLSGSGVFAIDSDLGIFSPDRSAYRRAFGHWHETAKQLYMPFPLECRPFPAPEVLLPLREYNTRVSGVRPKVG